MISDSTSSSISTNASSNTKSRWRLNLNEILKNEIAEQQHEQARNFTTVLPTAKEEVGSDPSTASSHTKHKREITSTKKEQPPAPAATSNSKRKRKSSTATVTVGPATSKEETYYDSKWMGMYRKLIEYKNEHSGSTNVPQNCDKYPQLGKWVTTQRSTYKKKRMLADRIRLLNKIEFEWWTHRKSWDVMYERLLVYKRNHQDSTDVPRRYDADPQLGAWVGTNRQQRKKGILSQDRIDALDKIDFDWGNQTRPTSKLFWDEMYRRLIKYREERGHTRVPIKSKTDPQLGGWVGTQRRKYKNKKISTEHTRLLDKIGFEWEVKRGAKLKGNAEPDAPPTFTATTFENDRDGGNDYCEREDDDDDDFIVI